MNNERSSSMMLFTIFPLIEATYMLRNVLNTRNTLKYKSHLIYVSSPKSMTSGELTLGITTPSNLKMRLKNTASTLPRPYPFDITQYLLAIPLEIDLEVFGGALR
jgi:hypothetical protein